MVAGKRKREPIQEMLTDFVCKMQNNIFPYISSTDVVLILDNMI